MIWKIASEILVKRQIVTGFGDPLRNQQSILFKYKTFGRTKCMECIKHIKLQHETIYFVLEFEIKDETGV